MRKAVWIEVISCEDGPSMLLPVTTIGLISLWLKLFEIEGRFNVC